MEGRSAVDRKHSSAAVSADIRTDVSMKKVYMLLTRFPDRTNAFMAWLSGSYYSHASIGLEENMRFYYSVVRKGHIVEDLLRYRQAFPCQLYELEVSAEVYERIRVMVKDRKASKKIRYARLGVLLSLLRIPHKHAENRYFCSEYVADVLKSSGAVSLRKHITRCFSKDLKSIPGMKLHFEGNIRNLITQYDLCACPATA